MTNETDEVNKGGRPRMFNTKEELLEKAEEYFQVKGLEGKPFTITGLALHLGFADRQSLIDYSKRDEFSCTVKRIKSRVEEQLEEGLHESAVAGIIFNLKNNFGWKDKQHVDVESPDGTMSPKSSFSDALEAAQAYSEIIKGK